MNGPPFFVVGAGRSGTTLLRVMLDKSPEVAIPPESHFIPVLWKRRGRYGRGGRIERPDVFLRDLEAFPRFQQWNIPPSSVRDQLDLWSAPTLPQAIEACYLAYVSRVNKTRWADKTPKYVNHISLLSRLFPDALFVHLIRDGRDVALSVLSREKMHRHAASAAYFWAKSVRNGRGAGRELGAARYLEVRYEDLVGEPEVQLGRLCGFLSLSFDPAMLLRDELALERVPPTKRHLHARLALPPTKGLRDWRSEMSPTEVREFEAMASNELADAGYELSTTPGRWTRLVASSRLLGTAARAGRRRARIALAKGLPV